MLIENLLFNNSKDLTESLNISPLFGAVLSSCVQNLNFNYVLQVCYFLSNETHNIAFSCSKFNTLRDMQLKYFMESKQI
jgi:hypothetical protein